MSSLYTLLSSTAVSKPLSSGRASIALLAMLAACGGTEKSESATTTGAGETSDTDGGDGGGDGGSDGGGDGGSDGGADGGSGGADYVASVQASCTTGESGAVVTYDGNRLQGEITWTIDFDATAEALGYVDCTYTRTFEGIERNDVEHICPGCDLIVEGTGEVVDGFEDCAEPLFGGEAIRTETWGFMGTSFYRRQGAQLYLGDDPLATLSARSGDGSSVSVGWESEYSLSDPSTGGFALIADGTMSWSPDPALAMTPYFAPRTEPYACGWECNDPGTLEGSYPLVPDAVLPNFRMRDQCGEMVDIHDFYGSYLVLDSAQPDCGPCLAMAGDAEAFRETMTAAGIPVRLIPLVGAGLAEVYSTPSVAQQDNWVERFSSTEPVLADRGWGYAALGPYLADYEGEEIAWPAWIIIAPDMTVIQGQIGYSSWDEMGDIIRADWEARGSTGPL